MPCAAAGGGYLLEHWNGEKVAFDEAMATFADGGGGRAAYDLSAFGTVADRGGGSGVILQMPGRIEVRPNLPARTQSSTRLAKFSANARGGHSEHCAAIASHVQLIGKAQNDQGDCRGIVLV